MAFLKNINCLSGVVLTELNQVFETLPIAAVVAVSLFYVQGDISPTLTTIEELDNI
jgi:hypothetical protein